MDSRVAKTSKVYRMNSIHFQHYNGKYNNYYIENTISYIHVCDLV